MREHHLSFLGSDGLARLLMKAALLLAVTGRTAAVDGAGLRVPPTIPDGAVATDRSAYFVTNTKGNIEAVDLKTGKTLWESEFAHRPLAVSGNKLIAQARVKDKPNTIRLVLLDLTAEGKLLKQSEELVVGFPGANVFTTEYDSGGAHGGTGGSTYTFGITAAVDKSEAIVQWGFAFNSYRISGRPLPPDQARSSGGGSGGWRLDLETGQVKPLTQVEGKGSTVPEVPGGLKELIKNDPVWDRPWITGDKGCVLLMRTKPDKESPLRKITELTLHLWEIKSGEPAGSINLFEGILEAGKLRRTADGGTLVLATEQAKGEHHVLLLSTTSDKRLADVKLKGPASIDLSADGKAVLIFDALAPRVVLLSGATGERLADLDQLKAPSSARLAGGGATVVVAEQEHVLFLSAATGKQLARHNVKDLVSVQTVCDDKTVVITDKLEVVLFSAVTAKQLADVDLKGPATALSTPDGGTVIISDQKHLVLLSAATGKQLADVSFKDKPTTQRLISEGRALLIAQASSSNKDVQHAVLLDTASGERLGDIDIRCGKDLKMEQVAGVMGNLVYTAPSGVGEEGKVGTNIVTAFDATSGELAWKKSFSSRKYTPPAYHGPYPP